MKKSIKKFQSIYMTRLLSKREMAKTTGGNGSDSFLPPPSDD